MITAPERYRFGAFELDCAALELRRDGDAIALEPRALDVLVYLVRHRNRVVSRDELVDAVWPGSFISDSALGQSVLKARRAVDDDGRRQEVIRTVHGRGLRFVAEVTTPPPEEPATAPLAARDPAAPPASVPRPRRIGIRRLAVVALPLTIAAAVAAWLWLRPAGPTAKPRVALLPFVNQTGDATLSWVEDGLPRLLARTLGRTASLETIADRSLAEALDRAGLPWDGALDRDRFETLRRNFGTTHAVSATITRENDLVYVELGLWQHGHRPRRLSVSAPRLPEALDEAVQVIGERLLGRHRDLPERAGFSDDPFVNRLYAMGLAEYGRDNYSGAESYFRVCLDREPDLQWARYETALCLRRQGKWDESLQLSEEVLAVAITSDDRRLQAAVHHNLGLTRWRLGDRDQAEQHYLAATAIAEAGGMRDVQAPAMLSLGILATDRGDFDRAETFERHALAIYREMADASGEASALNSLGVLAWRRGDLATSRERHQRALQIRRDLGLREREAASLNNLGTIAQATGHWDEASELFGQALAIRRQLDDRVGQASTLYNLSSLALLTAEPDRSRQLAEEALAIARELGDRQRTAWCLGQLGAIAAATGDPANARELGEQALAIYRELGDRHAETERLLDLGHLAVAADDLDAAEAHCDAARAIANVLGDRRLEGLEARLRGAIAARRGDLGAAEEHYRRALEIARELGHDSQVVTAAVDLAGLLLDRGDAAAAAELAPELERFADGRHPPAMIVRARLAAADQRPAEAGRLAEAARAAAGPLWTDRDQQILDRIAADTDG